MVSLTVRWPRPGGEAVTASLTLPGQATLVALHAAVRAALPGLGKVCAQTRRRGERAEIRGGEKKKNSCCARHVPRARGASAALTNTRARPSSPPPPPIHPPSLQSFVLTDLARDVASDADVAALAARANAAGAASAPAGGAPPLALTLWVADGPGGRLAAPVKVSGEGERERGEGRGAAPRELSLNLRSVSHPPAPPALPQPPPLLHTLSSRSASPSSPTPRP